MDRSPVPHGGRRRLHCHTCHPPHRAEHAAQVRVDDLLADPTITPIQHTVLARVAEAATAAGWTTRHIGTLLAGLRRVLDGQPNTGPVLLSRVRAEIPSHSAARLARAALDELGLLADDTVSTIRTWTDRHSDALPAGYRAEVRAWLIELADGGQRVRPRSTSTLYVYFGRVRPHLLTWAATREQLRQVTEDDIAKVLNSLHGHQRAGTFTALRSLFRFAKRHRLIFADPTRRLHVGAAPKRALLPMTDAEIAAVKQAVATPVQRLVVALAAVYAARAAAIRQLTLDDIDLAARRIRLGGHPYRLSEFVHQALLHWLQQRHRIWPHTPNRHVLISAVSAAGTEPINDYYLTYRLSLQGVQLEQIRGDRVLHEALAVSADPLHLATAFNLSTKTAIDYTDIARSLLQRPIEAAIQPFQDHSPASINERTRHR